MKFHDFFQGEIITKHGTYIYTFFKIIFSRTTGYFNQTWHKASLGDGDWRFVQMKGHVIPRKNISEIAKTHWWNLKIFSATLRNCHGNLAQSILRWWGFKFLKWKAPPFPRGHNYEKAKMHWQNLKIFSVIFFFRTAVQWLEHCRHETLSNQSNNQSNNQSINPLQNHRDNRSLVDAFASHGGDRGSIPVQT